MKKIAPSILSADFTRLEKEIRAVEDAKADYIHVDVMDGHFVPNITVGPFIVEAVRRATRLPLDVHLMIEEPDRYIQAFAKAGSDIITVHIEAATHLHRTVQAIKSYGIRAGAALNPATPVHLLDSIIEDLDLVLILSVNPGFGGQEFIPSALDKVRALRKMIDSRSLKTELEIDGGIKVGNIGEASRAGADVFVAGSAVFGSPDYKKTIRAMKKELKEKED